MEEKEGSSKEEGSALRSSDAFYSSLATGAAKLNQNSKDDSALTHHLDDDGWDPLDTGSMDEHRVKQYTALTELEAWYDQLKEFTFETQYLPLSLLEANAIIDAQDVEHNKEKSLSGEQKKALKGLQKRVNSAIKTFKLKEEEGVFIRLSTRSPKDAVLNSPYFKELLKEELADIKEGDENIDSIAFYVAAIKAMKITTGEQGIKDLFLRSYRVYQDLSRWRNYPEEFQMNVIIRKWEFIHPSMEFRGFVCKRRLNAVSQYIDCCYFEDLVKHKKKYKRKIAKFYKSIKDVVPLDKYVIDFAIIDGKVRVIELNPFFIKTGASLFNWQADLKVLTMGPDSDDDQDFEFRIIESDEDRRSKGFMNVREQYLHNTNTSQSKPHKGDESNCIVS